LGAQHPTTAQSPALGIGFREWVSGAFSSGRGNRSVAVYVRIGAAGKNVQMARYRKPPPTHATQQKKGPEEPGPFFVV